MCGIFGYFDQSGTDLEKSRVESMGSSIQHRGPDDQGIYYGKGCALGNQRLSIIDIAGGHQPFISDDGQVVVVQNGEIFNHIELAQELKGSKFECRSSSDTEVLLRLYEKEGIDFVKRLNGMFAIAIYDKKQDAVFLIRDRIGVKPLYVAQKNGKILFSSEIKSFWKTDFHKELNEEAIHHFLTFNYVPPPMTAFKGVTHLKPGHWMKIGRHGEVKTHQWWHLAQSQIEQRSEQQWEEEILDLLEDATRLRLRADVPFGAFLSGGIDSSTVVAFMSKNLQRPVLTYSIGFDSKTFDETPYALQASKMFGTTHRVEIVKPQILDQWAMALYHCDQPHGDVSFLPTYQVSALAAKDVKMVLTGDGGDELFAGYEKYQSFFASEASRQGREEFQKSYFDSISLFTSQGKNAIYNSSFASKMNGIDSYEIVKPLFEESQHWDRINQVLNIDMNLLLSGNNLVKPDRMGMAVSLEARTPFLDYRMMEMSFKIPGELKLKNNETKYILKKAVSNLIGKDLTYRKKQMFTVPIGDWFKKDLYDFCTKNLLSEKSFTLNFCNKDVVAKMIQDHSTGQKNHTREIRALLALEIWAKSFF